jgi:hypothetical protein
MNVTRKGSTPGPFYYDDVPDTPRSFSTASVESYPSDLEKHGEYDTPNWPLPCYLPQRPGGAAYGGSDRDLHALVPTRTSEKGCSQDGGDGAYPEGGLEAWLVVFGCTFMIQLNVVLVHTMLTCRRSFLWHACCIWHDVSIFRSNLARDWSDVVETGTLSESSKHTWLRISSRYTMRVPSAGYSLSTLS